MKNMIVLLILAALMLSACAGTATAPTTEAETVAPMDVAEIAKLEENARCPFLKVEATFTEDDGLHILVSNEAGVDIDHARLYVLWYDEAGNPIDVGGTVAPHMTKDALTQIKAMEKTIFILPTEAGSAQVKMIVTAAYFTDGTVWENAYAEEWLAYALANNT